MLLLAAMTNSFPCENRYLAPTTARERVILEQLKGALGPLSDGEQWVVLEAARNAPELEQATAAQFAIELHRGARMRDSKSALGRRGRGLGRQYVVRGDKSEEWYADLISQRIAGIAAIDPGVLSSRAKMWGSIDPLAPRIARRFVRSPVLALMTINEIQSRGIPLVGHSARLRPLKNGPRGWREVEIQVAWPTGTHTEKRLIRKLYLAWNRPSRRLKAIDSFGTEGLHFIEWDERGTRDVAPVESGSVLDAIRDWAERFISSPPYHSWRLTRTGAQPTAIWFLLTGRKPTIPAISYGWEMPGSGADTITLTALVGCTPESITSAFRIAQRRAQGGHAVPPIRLALLQFVAQEIGSRRLSRGDWPRLCEKWNRQAPAGWRYGRGSDGYRNMRRDYVEAKKRV